MTYFKLGRASRRVPNSNSSSSSSPEHSARTSLAVEAVHRRPGLLGAPSQPQYLLESTALGGRSSSSRSSSGSRGRPAAAIAAVSRPQRESSQFNMPRNLRAAGTLSDNDLRRLLGAMDRASQRTKFGDE